MQKTNPKLFAHDILIVDSRALPLESLPAWFSTSRLSPSGAACSEAGPAGIACEGETWLAAARAGNASAGAAPPGNASVGAAPSGNASAGAAPSGNASAGAIFAGKTSVPIVPDEASLAGISHSNRTFAAVVRRDASDCGRIPVGIRGCSRGERFGFFIDPIFIRSVISPESLAPIIRARRDEAPQLRFLSELLQRSFPFSWGVTGSFGISLALGERFWRADSDIDIRIRQFEPVSRAYFRVWQDAIERAGIPVDTQIETGLGGFALNEWLNKSAVLLKTDRGPIITSNPWSPNES